MDAKTLYEKASQYYIGGASAGGRFNTTLNRPVYIQSANGCRFTDVDGKEYIDYHMGAGAAFFGHNNVRLRKAVKQALDLGLFMNFDTAYHLELAELLHKMIPCAERIRLSNTGTECTMAALRVARAFTGKDIIVRFEGHFHGMHEMIWYNHNGERGEKDQIGEIVNIPDTAGVPQCFGDVIRNVEFNDIEAFQRIVDRYHGRIAGVILEPVSFNCGCYPARKEFLRQVREICTAEGIVLIFDEVICGLRMNPGCAQRYYGVTPDLAAFAKAIGGGFPIAALCGKKEIMNVLNPLGNVVMSGTYTGAIMPVLAAIECLKMAMEPGFYDKIDEVGNALYSGIENLMKINEIPGHVRGIGARFGIYFGVEDPEADYNWRKTGDVYRPELAKRFIEKAMNLGLYFHVCGTSAPAHYGFSAQHTMKDVEMTLDRIDSIFAQMHKEGL